MSPCTKVCKLDPAHQVCVGCFRTVQEIGSWIYMDEEEQARTVAQSEIRRTAWRIEKRKKEMASE